MTKHHEASDVTELRRLAEAVREYAELDPDGTDPHDLANERLAAILALGGEWASVLGLFDRLAHMTEARDNARAEVERLTAQIEAVRSVAGETVVLEDMLFGGGISTRILAILDGVT